jgi:hypothetical protein
MAAIAAGVGAMVMCSSSLAAAMMMGGSEETPAAAAGAGAGAKTPADPCAGLVDDSLASTIPVKCLQKIFKDEGCTEEGTRYPGDDYNGWWRKDDGAGNYAGVKRDINAWATMTDFNHVQGCGRAGIGPCTGLVDDSLASTIPAKCLQKIFKDEGCTEEGTRYPGDDYNGWWRKDDGGGNYANVKRDINAWATMQDADHLAGCGRAT